MLERGGGVEEWGESEGCWRGGVGCWEGGWGFELGGLECFF